MGRAGQGRELEALNPNSTTMNTIPLTRYALLFAIAASTPMVVAESAIAEKPADADKAVKPGTIASIVKDGTTFSILQKAVVAAGLEETFNGKGPYTVFAPTDDAFGKLPKGALDKLMLPENKEKLRTLLLFHVLAGQTLSSELKDGKVKSSSGDEIEIDVDGKKIEVSDAKIANADVMASNGVIHVIDRVMVPKSLDGFAGLDDD